MLIAGIPNASHRDLAHAWGREKGFHNVLVSQVCERRGEIVRKKRSDKGRQLTEEQKASFKEKLQRARATKKVKTGVASEVAAADPAVAGVAGGVTAVHAVAPPPVAALNDLPPASVEEMVHEQAEECGQYDDAVESAQV